MRTLKTIVIQYNIAFLLFCLVSLNGFGQSAWQKAYGTAHNDYPRHMIRLSNGGYLLAGESYVQSNGIYTTGYLVKTKSNGDTIWTKRFFPSDSEISVFLLSVYEIHANSYLIGGSGDRISTLGKYGLLINLDSNGNILWKKKYYNTYQFFQIVDVLGDSIVFSSPSVINMIDTSGALIWSKNIGSNRTKIIKNNKGSYCFLYNGAGGVYYREIKPSGQIIKDQLFGVGSGIATGALIQDSEHNFIEVNPTADSKILHAAKFDTTLNILWDKTYSSLSVGVNVNALVQTVEGGYVMIGQFFNDPEGDICFFKIDKEGNKEYFTWLTRFGREEKAIDAYGDSDGEIVFFGYGDEGPHGGVDLLLAKVNSEGTMGTPFLSPAKELNLTFYPNPTTNSFTLIIPEQSNHSIIKIYNMYGQEILEEIHTNKNNFIIDLSNHPDGYYICTVVTENSKYDAKIIKIK